MDEYRFEDLLAGGTVTCSYPGLETVRVGGVSDAESCESLFFPGCSFINYALPLVQSVYDLLVNAGQCDGISLLCCGKILEYEGDGGAARAAFEQQFRDHIAGTSIKRIVAACPNCVSALRRLLAKDERTSSIEVVALPRVLVDMGYRVDQETAASVVYNDGRIEAEGLLSRPGNWRVCRCIAGDYVRDCDGRAQVRPQTLVLLRFASPCGWTLRLGRQDGAPPWRACPGGGCKCACDGLHQLHILDFGLRMYGSRVPLSRAAVRVEYSLAIR